MRKTIFSYLLLLSGLLFCSPKIWGQTTAFQAEFSTFVNRSYGGKSFIALASTDDDYPEWVFSTCYANKGGYLYVASSTSAGHFTTPVFSVTNATQIKLIVKNENATKVSFTLSSSNGTLGQTSFTIPSAIDNYEIITYLNNGSSNTRLTVSAESSNTFFLKSIVVNNIQKVFYESFNNMSSVGFTPGDAATPELCDNSNSKFAGNVWQIEKAICLMKVENSYYEMPPVAVEEGRKYLLTFNVAKGSNAKLKVSCSGDASFGVLKTTNLYDAYNPLTDIEDYIDEFDIWQTCQLIVTNMTSSTRISFYGEYVYLDEVSLIEIPNITIDQAEDNYVTIVCNQTFRDVTLSRILTPNIWCPLCLPFSITPSKMATDMGVTCEVRTLTSVTNGVFSFDKVDAETSIPAGTPFLIKVPSLVTNPTFRNVTVSNTPATVATGSTVDYKFIGTYSPVELNTDGTHLFLGTDGKLYKPSTDAGANLLGGLRAYFEVPAAAQGARIMINDEVSTVDNVRTATGQQLFNLYGRQVGNRSPKRGLYIVRPAEGRLLGNNGQKLIVK